MSRCLFCALYLNSPQTLELWTQVPYPFSVRDALLDGIEIHCLTLKQEIPMLRIALTTIALLLSLNAEAQSRCRSDGIGGYRCN